MILRQNSTSGFSRSGSASLLSFARRAFKIPLHFLEQQRPAFFPPVSHLFCCLPQITQAIISALR
jgi:hypothetical protein